DVGPDRAGGGERGEPRTVLRADGGDPPTEPADRAGVGRVVRRPPDVDRAEGGGHRADAIRGRDAEPGDRRAGTDPSVDADRARIGRGDRGSPADLARGERRLPARGTAPVRVGAQGVVRLAAEKGDCPLFALTPAASTRNNRARSD